MGLGTNTLLGRVRRHEVRERRQEMLVCASAEVKRVLGEREGRGVGGKREQSSSWERIAMEGHEEPGFRFTKTWV